MGRLRRPTFFANFCVILCPKSIQYIRQTPHLRGKTVCRTTIEQ